MHVKWKIYYGDDTTFSSDDGEPNDAPAHNVQCIVVVDQKVGRMILRDGDFYFHRNGEWFATDQFGMIDQVAEMGIVKTGRALSRSDFKKIIEVAIADEDFPRKSADLPYGTPYSTKEKIKPSQIG